MTLDRQKVLTTAQKFASKGQYDRAIQQYELLLRDDASDVRTWLKVGDLHQKMGHTDKAVETYERVGEYYNGQGFFLKAVAAYNRILKLRPERLDIALRLGDTYEQLQHTGDAISTYEQVGAAYAKAGNVKAMLDVLGRMVRVDPTNIPVRIKYAEALSKTGQRDEAAAEFEAGAELLLAENRTEDYLKVSERLLFHRPKDTALALKLARVHLKTKDPKRALGKLQLSFKENPKDIETLELLAETFEQLEQNDKALSVYRELARILQEVKKLGKRAEIMAEVLRLDPSDQEAKAAVQSAASEPEIEILEDDDLVVLDDDSDILLIDDDDEVTQYIDADDSEDDFLALEVEEDAAIEVSTPPPHVPVNVSAPTVLEERIPPQLQAELDEMYSDRPPKPAGEAPPEYELSGDLDGEPETIYEPAVPKAEGANPFATIGFESNAPQPESEQADLEVEELEELEVEALEVEAASDDDGIEVFDAPLGVEVDVDLSDPLAPEESTGDAQISRLLAECDVFERYGLTDKVILQLEAVLDIDDTHLVARTRLKDAFLKAGRPQDAGRELLALAARTEDPKQSAIYTKQADLLGVSADALEVEHLDDDSDVLFLDDPSVEVESFDLGTSDERNSDVATPAPPAAAEPPHLELELMPDEVTPQPIIPPAAPIPKERFSSVPPPVVDPVDLAGLPSIPVEPRAEANAPKTEPPPPGSLPPGAQDSALAEAEAAAMLRAEAPTAEVEEILDEVDFYIMQSLWEVSRSTLEDALVSYPDHPLLLDKLQQVMESEQAAAALAAEAVPQVQDDASHDVFAMAEKLADELGPTIGSEPDEEVTDLLDVDQVFEQFKRGVAEQVDENDSATHFDLGIAYKEMGLIDDAINEFTVAMKNNERRCLCHTMVGLCRIEKGDVTGAISEFKKGLYVENKTQAEEVGLYYELGASYQLLEDENEALYYFNKVLKRESDYRDVAERVAAIKSNSEPDAATSLDLDDLDAAFDDLMSDD